VDPLSLVGTILVILTHVRGWLLTGKFILCWVTPCPVSPFVYESLMSRAARHM
jgi:hypothetical protein